MQVSGYRRPESVLVVVYVSSQQLLLLQRVNPQGYWQSVTGSLEWGESAAECAQRELREETGLDAFPVNTGWVNQFEILPQWQDRYAAGVRVNTEYVFYVSLDQVFVPKLSVQEHCAYQWCDASAAMQKCFSHTNAEAIERLLLAASE